MPTMLTFVSRLANKVEHVVRSQSNLFGNWDLFSTHVFLMFVLRSTPTYSRLKYKCPFKSVYQIRHTYHPIWAVSTLKKI